MSSAFSSSRWLPRRFLILAAATLSVGALSAQEEKVTYDDHVRPLLENKCFSCHNPDKKKGGLELTSYAGLLNGGSGGAVVDAGNPTASRLWTCSSKKQEPYMPPEGAPLEAKDLALLSKWIAGGVLQAKGSVAQKSSRPKVDLTFAGGAGKPTGAVARPHDVLLEPVLVTAHTSAITAMAASPWTSLLAVAGQHQILLYDTESKDLAGILPYTEGYARSLKFSANGSLLILGGGRGGKFGHAVVWDVATGRRVAEIGKEFDQVMSADITPDHRKVALATNGKKVKSYDVATGELLYTIAKHTEWVTGVSFSPDGILLASSDRNGNVMVWEAESGGEFYNLGQHTASVTGLAWRADSNILASCSVDGTVSTWEMKTGKRVANWSSHGNVQSVAFTPDGKVLTCGADGNTALWDINGSRIQQAQSVHQDDVVSKVVALYDSKVFVTGNWLGEVRMFDVATGRDLTRISSNPPKIADRLVETEKRLAEIEPTLAPAEAAVKAAEARLPAAEAALAKVKGDEPSSKKLAEHEAKNAEVVKGLAYWQGMSAKAKTAAEKATAAKGVADNRGGLTYLGQEITKLKPAASAFRAAEAELAKAKADLTAAQAKARDVVAEVAAHRERIVFLKAAQFNVGVLTEQDKLTKLEQDIADLIAAKAENEAAKVSDARRIESSKKTIAQNAELIPKQEAELKALQAEFAAQDKTLSPFRQSEAEALGKVETQAKLIESRNEAIVRLGLDRDAAVNVVKAAVEEFRIKFTTPLRARLTEATTRAEEAKKRTAEFKLAVTKAKAESEAAHARAETARQSLAKLEATSKQAAVDLAAAEAAFAEARSFKAVFSFHYFSRKQESAQRLAGAKASAATAQSAQTAGDKVLAAAKAAEQLERDHVGLAVAAFDKSEKEAAPAIAELAALTKERAARIVEREKLSAGAAVAEKDYAAKLPALQAALKQAQDTLPALEKSLITVRTQLAEAAKPLEVKRVAMEAAAKTLELTRREAASAEKSLLAAQKDIPQRDKNLEDIAKTYAELTPQVEPMKAKVKTVQEQYFAMLPKHEEPKKN
ncbi:MAG: c-type cytochrome domain-containing protein [Verrucomicrobiota bacterium]